jgi:hypothetical protein
MLQSFVKHDLATMTLEEVQKKLGFVRTACEGRLNRGETIEAEGLKVEDDYSTRTRKTQPHELLRTLLLQQFRSLTACA